VIPLGERQTRFENKNIKKALGNVLTVWGGDEAIVPLESGEERSSPKVACGTGIR
jgi:hypothetical protein